ncbi:MAG: hypothetical protein KDJ36_08660, partial [Hyphomicrobiaceae bacterium]|nr:hypothetical protein [Hyphomicrobiaceae bacterium]
CLSDLEPGWLDTPDAGGRLEKLEERFGRSAISEIAISDREHSGGWVPGGTSPVTPLRAAVRDHARWRGYLAGMVDFFAGVMADRAYDFVFCYPVQDGPSVAAGHVAHHLGIPFLSPKAIGFQAQTCLFDDVKTMVPVFRHDFMRSAVEPSALAPAYLDDARRTLAAFRARPAPPDYMALANAWTYAAPGAVLTAALLKRALFQEPPISLRYPYPLSRLVWEYRKWLWMLRDRNHGRFKQPSVLEGQPFAYFPLHYEPEASTLVSAPWHTDQTAVIEQAAKALPAGWVLAVKEHVPMLGRRPQGFYDRLAAMPKVVLISPYADSFALNRAARLTVTITGTAGLEAVLLQKPVVFLGASPMHILDRGYIYCPDTNRLGDAISNALSVPVADDETLVRFLAALAQHAVDVPSRLIWGGTGVITDEVVAGQPAAVARFAELIMMALTQAGALKPISERPSGEADDGGQDRTSRGSRPEG